MLGVTNSDLLLTAVLGGLVVAAILVFYKEFLVLSFDPVLAVTLRLPDRLLEYLLLVMIAVTIVVSLQTVGIALMVSYAGDPRRPAAYLLTKRLHVMMMLAALIAAFSGVAGLYLSLLRQHCFRRRHRAGLHCYLPAGMGRPGAEAQTGE